MLSCPRCPVVKYVRHVVMSGDDVCCSVVFGTLVGVFVFSVIGLSSDDNDSVRPMEQTNGLHPGIQLSRGGKPRLRRTNT